MQRSPLIYILYHVMQYVNMTPYFATHLYETYLVLYGIFSYEPHLILSGIFISIVILLSDSQLRKSKNSLLFVIFAVFTAVFSRN